MALLTYTVAMSTSNAPVGGVHTTAVGLGCSPGCDALEMYVDMHQYALDSELHTIKKNAFEEGCRFKRDLTLHFNATVTEMEDSHEIEIEDLRRYMADKVDFLQREAAGRQTQHIAAIQRLETMYGEQELVLAAAHRDIRRLVAMIAEEQRGQDGGQDGGSDGVDFGLVVDDDSDDGGIGQYFPN